MMLAKNGLAGFFIVFGWCLTAMGQGGASTWREFRGPGGSGVADNCRPPVILDAQHATWATDVPPGYSSPVLSRRHVFLTAVDGHRLVTLAFDKHTGELVWRKECGDVSLERTHEASSPATSTPCVDDECLYVYFGSYGLICYDHDGRERWTKPIPTPKSLYGMSTSPILDGDRLMMVLDNDANLPDSALSQSRIISVQTTTGQLIWETARPFHRSSWSTPTIWDYDGGRDLVVLGSGWLRGYDVDTGIEKWYLDGFSRETIARPIVGKGHLFASSSMLGGVSDEQPDLEPFWQAVLHFDANQDQRLERTEMIRPFTFPLRPGLPVGHPGFGLPLPQDDARRSERLDGMFAAFDKDKDGYWTKEEFVGNLSFDRGKPNLVAVRPGGTGDVSETHLAWSLHRGIPEIPSPIFYQDRIYLVCDGGILSAVDAASGKVLYRRRLGAAGHYRSSPVIANDHLYVISDEGIVSVVTTGDEYHLAHQQALGERVAATPAIDDATIYIRTLTQLLAYRTDEPQDIQSPTNQ